jgi:hypothetical protein
MSYIIDQNSNLIVNGVNVTTGLAGVKLTIAAKAEANALAAEVSSRIAADASILENTNPAALDSLKEVVDAFVAADSNLNGAITTLSNSVNSRINTVEAAASTLTTRVTAVEGINVTQETAINSIATAIAGLVQA